MTSRSSHGAASRRPVVHGGRTIRGLKQRTLEDGTTVYEARLRIDGKDITRRLDADTKTDAVREFENLRADRNRGVEHENALLNPTVAEAWDEWLAFLESRVGFSDERLRVAEGWAYSVRKVRGRTLELAPWFGRLRIAAVKPPHLRRLITELTTYGYASSTVAQKLRIVSGLCEFARKQGYLGANPVRDLPYEDRPSGKRVSKARYLSAGEVERLLAHAGDLYRPVLATLAYAGLRIGEAMGLRWGDDIDFEAGLVIVNGQLSTSGGRHLPHAKSAAAHASVPMVPALRRELLAHRARMAERNLALVRPGRFAFLRPRGGVWHQGAFSYELRRIAKLTGLNPPGVKPVSCHDLRHS